MHKMLMLILAACAAAVTGCKSIEVERHASTVATDSKGEVVRTAAGEPVILDGGWDVNYFQHWNTQRFDTLDAKAGEASLSINNYQSSADTNLVALVDKSITGLGELATKVAAAYATVAGGGAQADTVASLAAKAVNLFTSSGGDTSKATVTTSDGAVTITDGSSTVVCKDGDCTYQAQ